MGLGWHPIYEMENKSHVWNHQPDHGRLNNSTTQTRYEPYRSNLIASWLLLCLSSTSSTTQHCHLSQFRWIYPDRTTTAYRRMSKNYLFTRLKSAYLRLNQSGNPSPDPDFATVLASWLLDIHTHLLPCLCRIKCVVTHRHSSLSPADKMRVSLKTRCPEMCWLIILLPRKIATTGLGINPWPSWQSQRAQPACILDHAHTNHGPVWCQ